MDSFQPEALDAYDPAFSREDASKYLSISPRTLDAFASEGRLQKVKVGHRTAFRLSELNRYLDSCTQQTEAQNDER